MKATVRAETGDQAAADQLREVVRGFIALARLQAGAKAGVRQRPEIDPAFGHRQNRSDDLSRRRPKSCARSRHGLVRTGNWSPNRNRNLGTRNPGTLEGATLFLAMPEQVFFYGTLRTGFNRTTRAGIDAFLKFSGRASINAKLFDLGIYPAAVPASDARVWGEVFEISDPPKVLAALDRIEGHRPAEPERSLYNRVRVCRDARRWAHGRCLGVFLQRAARARAAHHFRRLHRAFESEIGFGLRGESRLRRSEFPSRSNRVDEMDDGVEHVVGRFNVFEAGAIVDDLLIHVADRAVGHAALQDDRSIAKCQPDVVERVEVQREMRFRPGSRSG